MVSLSKTISTKIKEKQGDITDDEVSGIIILLHFLNGVVDCRRINAFRLCDSNPIC